MEDVVGVLDGRPEIVAEVRVTEPAVRAFLAETFRGYLENENFLEALEALLYPDAVSQARRPLVLLQMAQIAGQSKSML